jgi:prepilin-type N-terminal cleavage/methylation domain-containing protein
MASAFTLVELLVVIVIILILIGLLLPAIGVVRNHVAKSHAIEQIAELHIALQHYASEDRRHTYPPQTSATDLSLRLDPNGVTPGNLNLLLNYGYVQNVSLLDLSSGVPYQLDDPWGHPYQYQVDSNLLGVSGAQRPQPLTICPAWNTAGTRPWGYVWSLGRSGQSDGSQWLYVRDDQ